MARRRLRRDDAIDLQIHTTLSDGQWSPADLFAYLASAEFRAVAITDHDCLDSRDELRALGAARGVLVIPAVEMTTSWRGLSAHLLCFAAQFQGEALAGIAARTTRAQLENTHAVYAALRAEGYVFPRQAEVLQASTGHLQRPIDNARLLLAHGYSVDLPAALARISAAGYRSITAPLAECVAAAHADGAVAILAHPGRGGGEIQRYDPPLLAELLAAVPLDGLEARYPTHTPAQETAYLALAAERALLVSAGSDSHGPQQRLPVPYPAWTCAALLARCGIQVDA